jgi:hypothetical protein
MQQSNLHPNVHGAAGAVLSAEGATDDHPLAVVLS